MRIEVRQRLHDPDEADASSGQLIVGASVGLGMAAPRVAVSGDGALCRLSGASPDARATVTAQGAWTCAPCALNCL